MFFPFCLAMSMMGFMISTLAPTAKAANASSYGIVLLAIVVESFVADNNILSLLFTDNASSLVLFLRNILLFYPPFSYTKVRLVPFRSLPTSQCTVATTTIFWSIPGIQANIHMILIPSLHQLQAISSLKIPSLGTQILHPWEYSTQTLLSLLF